MVGVGPRLVGHAAAFRGTLRAPPRPGHGAARTRLRARARTARAGSPPPGWSAAELPSRPGCGLRGKGHPGYAKSEGLQGGGGRRRGASAGASGGGVRRGAGAAGRSARSCRGRRPRCAPSHRLSGTRPPPPAGAPSGGCRVPAERGCCGSAAPRARRPPPAAAAPCCARCCAAGLCLESSPLRRCTGIHTEAAGNRTLVISGVFRLFRCSPYTCRQKPNA